MSSRPLDPTLAYHAAGGRSSGGAGADAIPDTSEELRGQAGLTTAAFDGAAAGYDASFTDHRLGRWLRDALHTYLDDLFGAEQRIIEFGCGTGEDALRLARRGIRVHSTDVSPAMLGAARRKAKAAGVAGVTFGELDAANPSGWEVPVEKFDGALAAFGVLNCLPVREPFAAALATILKPGGKVAVVVMGPLCPWEWGWYALRGRPRTAFRRFRSGAHARIDGGGSVRVWYPGVRQLRKEFAPHFRHTMTRGIGVLLPPTFAQKAVDRWPSTFSRLAAADARAGASLPGRLLNDHYLAIFERTGDGDA